MNKRWNAVVDEHYPKSLNFKYVLLFSGVSYTHNTVHVLIRCHSSLNRQLNWVSFDRKKMSTSNLLQEIEDGNTLFLVIHSAIYDRRI